MSWFKKDVEDKEIHNIKKKKVVCKYCKQLIFDSCLIINAFCDDKGNYIFAHWKCAEDNDRLLEVK